QVAIPFSPAGISYMVNNVDSIDSISSLYYLGSVLKPRVLIERNKHVRVDSEQLIDVSIVKLDQSPDPQLRIQQDLDSDSFLRLLRHPDHPRGGVDDQSLAGQVTLHRNDLNL